MRLVHLLEEVLDVVRLPLQSKVRNRVAKGARRKLAALSASSLLEILLHCLLLDKAGLLEVFDQVRLDIWVVRWLGQQIDLLDRRGTILAEASEAHLRVEATTIAMLAACLMDTLPVLVWLQVAVDANGLLQHLDHVRQLHFARCAHM